MEIERYRQRETAGFRADVAALEEHIETLKRVAPRLASNVLHGSASRHLAKLQADLHQAKMLQVLYVDPKT